MKFLLTVTGGTPYEREAVLEKKGEEWRIGWCHPMLSYLRWMTVEQMKVLFTKKGFTWSWVRIDTEQ